MTPDWMEGVDRRLDRSSLVLAVAAMAGAFFLHSAKSALSIGAGALLSYINFHWLKQAVDFAVTHVSRQRARKEGYRALRRPLHFDRPGAVCYDPRFGFGSCFRLCGTASFTLLQS